MVLLPIIELPHTSRYYRLVINRSEVAFWLTETNLTAKLSWSRGVTLYSMALDTPITLLTAFPVALWKIKLLKSLLQVQHYAAIQIVTDSDMEIVALHTPRDATASQSMYPPLA